MFVIPGRSAGTCERVSRREWLRLGGLGTFGLGTADLLARRGCAAPSRGSLAGPHGPAFGRAKSCIVLFLFGAPAHQDTWDLKPEAPLEVRGEFLPIATNRPGITVSEHIPLLAARADKYLQIRSVTHPDNTHTVAMHYMLTGVRHKRPATNPQNAADDFPTFGAVANWLQRRGDLPAAPEGNGSALPAGITLNGPANQVSANNHIFPGFFAGFLGAGYDPLFVSQHADQPGFAPFTAVDATPRLVGRRTLRELLDSGPTASTVEGSRLATRVEGCYQQAFDLLTSPAARGAFDVSREPETLRQRYGMTPFGQGCLLARRLVEAGVPLVTVNWQRDDAYWDTHSDNFHLHKNKLLPNLDRGLSTLLDDLSERGLLDETLVVALGEFGRTPKINGSAGRDHWAPCNTVVMAGGGLQGGQVHGASDKTAAYPARNPVLPEDLAATIYHLLGIAPETLISTPEGRPMALSSGEVIAGLL